MDSAKSLIVDRTHPVLVRAVLQKMYRVYTLGYVRLVLNLSWIRPDRSTHALRLSVIIIDCNFQETRGETGGTKLWRRISMINVSSNRKLDNQVDVLGHTTWGIRKVKILTFPHVGEIS